MDIFKHLDRIPRAGDAVTKKGVLFKVQKMEGNRIISIIITGKLKDKIPGHIDKGLSENTAGGEA
jgi:CBS domain containing-hemolysin-like protein